MFTKPLIDESKAFVATTFIAATLDTLARAGTNYRGLSITSLKIHEVFALALIGNVAYQVFRLIAAYPLGFNKLKTHPVPTVEEQKSVVSSNRIETYTKEDIGAHTVVAILASTATTAGAVALYGLPITQALTATIALTLAIAGSFFVKNKQIESARDKVNRYYGTNKEKLKPLSKFINYVKQAGTADYNQWTVEVRLFASPEKLDVTYKELREVVLPLVSQQSPSISVEINGNTFAVREAVNAYNWMDAQINLFARIIQDYKDNTTPGKGNLAIYTGAKRMSDIEEDIQAFYEIYNKPVDKSEYEFLNE